MPSILIKNAQIVNENRIQGGDVYIKRGLIRKLGSQLDMRADIEINAGGRYLLPGLIDDQVHFREPGLTHKADIYNESRAAVAGGVTSFMEMPNTIPNTVTQELLERKYATAAATSLANYSFYMGATNNNLDEVLKTDARSVCGVKVFMGSSTGNMLVDNYNSLERLFSSTPLLIATHCEDEATIQNNLRFFREKYGDSIDASMHPLIRSANACYKSSSLAVELATKHSTRLHILHISTKRELELFDNSLPLADKKITAEACIHHLWFNDGDYQEKGNLIKWNPAVKTKEDQQAILEAVLNGCIDVIATDHAPHTFEEKMLPYIQAPSGGPLVQHSLQVLLEMHAQKKLLLEQIAEKAAHNPAICFGIEKRGFIREGYWADLVLVDLTKKQRVEKSNILSKCKWSPFESYEFNSAITHTIVSGNLVYNNGVFNESKRGERLFFNRDA